MKNLLLLLLCISTSAFSSIVGITTHPLSDEARVLSAEMTGYMSQRHEMGAGIRYTQGFNGNLFDVTAAGAQDSRNMTVGAGVDLEILREDVSQPRISFKPYAQQMRFENETSTFVGGAPTLRKGIAVAGKEIFPFLSLPSGVRLTSDEQEVDFFSSLTIGASMAIPQSHEKLVLSVEANKDLGATSDYVGVLISWVWN